MSSKKSDYEELDASALESVYPPKSLSMGPTLHVCVPCPMGREFVDLKWCNAPTRMMSKREILEALAEGDRNA